VEQVMKENIGKAGCNKDSLKRFLDLLGTVRNYALSYESEE
jgi:hypothetical protein